MNTYRHASDENLLLAIGSGKQEAINELYRRYAHKLRSIILRSLHCEHNSEDVLQEVFIHIWRFSSTYQPTLSAAKTWITRITQNRVVDLLRSRRYKQSRAEAVRFGHNIHTDDQYALPQAANTAWNDVVSREHTSQVSFAMSRLPEIQRNLIHMAFIQGCSHQEVSQSTGIPLGTVKTRIRTGMKNLRSHLSHYAKDFS